MMSAILNYFASEIWEDDSTLALSRILLRYDECNLRPFNVSLQSRRSYEEIGTVNSLHKPFSLLFSRFCAIQRCHCTLTKLIEHS